ncbi:MAG: acylglycerol kinase family protein, partial [Oscillospiraceae bacterium]|nr:acylglycerol kinase family protein [Oscillospiraceae bacterium]
MKHVFIINPNAGKTDSTRRIYDMADALRKNHGLDVQCILTRRQGHAIELARELCRSGEELRFYACGGDGTANEVANGVIGFPNAAMTVIPVGTGNDFLRNFGDAAALVSDAENLWDSPVQEMDAISVNGRYALTIACSGL